MKRFCMTFLVFALVQAVFGQLSGPLSGTLGPGTYHVIGDISVEFGDSLQLMRGTTFNFDGPYPFYILGTLLAEGTETDSIIFITDTLTNPDRWRGLRFYYSTSSGSRLSYCVIQFGGQPDSYGYGGGVLCYDSSPMITNCLIAHNTAYSGGGGLCLRGSETNPIECIITHNNATFSGGGVYCYLSSSTYTNCIISNNSSHDGGGIGSQQSSRIFENCFISNNIADIDGGGVFCFYQDSLLFNRCVINDNSARFDGGAVLFRGSVARFTNCTIDGNVMEPIWGGGSVQSSGPLLHLRNTIISSSIGSGIYYYSAIVEIEVEYCSFFGNSSGDFGRDVPDGFGQFVTTNANGDSCDMFNNIFLDPMFVDTTTGDYHLLPGSPCIDAGDPELPLDPDSTIADIGAFYFDQTAAESPIELLPTAHALHPNWPNPFNPTTTIRYDVKRTGQVQLTIYNLLGRKVTTLIDSRHLAGSYTVSWNAANLPSGIYLCRIEVPGFTQTRKLVLLK